MKKIKNLTMILIAVITMFFTGCTKNDIFNGEVFTPTIVFTASDSLDKLKPDADEIYFTDGKKVTRTTYFKDSTNRYIGVYGLSLSQNKDIYYSSNQIIGTKVSIFKLSINLTNFSVNKSIKIFENSNDIFPTKISNDNKKIFGILNGGKNFILSNVNDKNSYSEFNFSNRIISNDFTKFLWVEENGDSASIWVSNYDNSNKVKIITKEKNSLIINDISNDNTKICYSIIKNGKSELFLIDLNNKAKEIKLTNFSNNYQNTSTITNVIFSKDSKNIYYLSNTLNKIYKQNILNITQTAEPIFSGFNFKIKDFQIL
mgnify:CR=1 FL=1